MALIGQFNGAFMSSEVTPAAPTATDQILSPVVDGNGSSAQVNSAQPTVDKAVEPVVADPVVVDPVADPAKPADDTNKHGTTPEWAQKRINELTAARYAAERKATEVLAEKVALEKLNKEILAGKAAAEPAKPTAAMGEDEIERRAQEKAGLIAQANEFNRACDTIAEAGKKEFQDWGSALSNLNLVGALGKDVAPTFLENVVELRNPTKVLHHLGTNMDEAARIAKLPPAKMAMEMARLEAQLSAPPAPVPLPPVSNAPAPVITVGGSATPGMKDLSDPTISMDEYNMIRNKQQEDRRNRYKRV